MYEDGKVVSHNCAWLAGKNGARDGLIMPGKPRVGKKYYQDIVPRRGKRPRRDRQS